ncbi:lytic murein transglycosylase [Streptomyces sp. NPDC101062]|uniref:lytic transglycosylase domain-containing protein n=1 Tax=unclassified Streptomyces TaxID=2593676 RepID=UPI002E79F880|nr:lytic murein transglycosylase [Streptomyces sp. JV176]MEE1801675.1 lytic murein transglycosylase [Streptomyces sp. JV176]
MPALFGSRLRRGATTTAVAAAAIAALSASQAPGAIPTGTGGAQAADATPSPDTAVTGNSPYYTELPPLTTPDKPGTSIELPATGPAEAGIPATVLAAYKRAEQTLTEDKPGCNLPWQLLAAIGKVESGQARGGQVDADGTTNAPILGPVLNGVGFANISDTDNGLYDGDTTHDRAVGPMQFIPSTWATWGQDGNGDGRKDPNNIYDAALAAGYYLCAGNRDLSVEADLHRAILGYNQSREYLNTVLTWFRYYKNGTHEVPDGQGVLPVGSGPGSPTTVQPSPTPTRTPIPTPSTTPKPSVSKPSKPATPDTPSGTPSKPPTTGPGTGSPTPPKPGGGTSPSPGDTEPPGTPTPKPVVKTLVKTGPATATAVAGSRFTEGASVRATDAAGKPVADVSVRFEIVGDTDARFAPGKAGLTVVTGADGKATAPVVQAGEVTGAFTIRATVVDNKDVAGVDYKATVTARQADELARTADTALTAAPGAEFTAPVEVKATYQGAAAPNVAATAAFVTSATDDTVPADSPYFKDADGNPLRTLTELKTDANGVLQLPKIFAGDTAGTFLLRIGTEGGATLTVELTVA